MTTTARTHATAPTLLEEKRAAAWRYASTGALHHAAHIMRGKCDDDHDAITKNLRALALLPAPNLTDEQNTIAAGIAAQTALNAIRKIAAAEVEKMTATETAALLDDPDATPTERELATDHLHNLYAQKIGEDAYDETVQAWIENDLPNTEARAIMLTELGVA